MVKKKNNNNSKIKIIVCYHENSKVIENDFLLPIHVGKSLNPNKLKGVIGDNTGDNISEKNGSYCELTGLYWLWKNVDADVYGLFHYRRFLDLLVGDFEHVERDKILVNSPIYKKELNRLMKEYDLILPVREYFLGSSLYKQYEDCHNIKDLDIVIDIIKDKYPDYVDTMNNVLADFSGYFTNIFIAKKDFFNEYCTWIFDILSEAEKRIDISEYDSYQKRVFGFLAERLFNVFIQYKITVNPNFKIKNFHVAFFKEDLKTKNLVVGAGLSGATIANLIATQLNEEVVVIDKRDCIAGNCYDYRDENGIMVHKYGSHIFHTDSDKVWQFLSQFAEFNNYEHKVVGNINGSEVSIPFNLNSLYILFPEDKARILVQKLSEKYGFGAKVSILEFQDQDDEDLKMLADFVYEKIFLNYTKKQWGVSPEKLDKSVMERVPIYISYDNRYFQDKYQGIPVNGYTKLVENMLNNEKISVSLNKNYSDINVDEFERVFYTGSIDEYFNYELGILPYRSVDFDIETLSIKHFQSKACVNYPNSEMFTRIHEYKYYLFDKSSSTVIAKEYSTDFEIGKNERFYPVPMIENKKLYERYLDKSKAQGGVYFLGRLGDYKYYNMDKAVERAMNVFEEVFNGE